MGVGLVTSSAEPTQDIVKIHCEVAGKLNFACHQNSYAALRDLRIENVDESRVLNDLKVTVEADPSFLKSKTWHIDRINPSSTVSIKSKDLDLNGQFLLGLTESVSGTLTVYVESDGDTIAEVTRKVEILAPNEWGGAGFMPELLAAFCMPNDPAIDQIIRSASKVLRRAGKADAIEGYASGSRQRVWEIVSAIYAAVANLGISYAAPPASFETNGQKIRQPGQIVQSRVATCLDTALLLASAFEQAGLNPIVALLKEHALVGVWLQPEKLAGVTNDEAEVLRKRFQLRELLLIEATLATSHPAPRFSLAVQRAMDSLEPESDARFVTAVDISRARAHRISPLAMRSPRDRSGGGTEEDAAVQLALEEAPALPNFDQDIVEEKPCTAAGRIERWHRKLLDLTARNPMLNHRSSKSSLEIYCPRPGLLEDKLAEGARISIVSAPEPPTQEQDRELYSQRTGEQLDEAYALDALEQRQVLVSLPKDELEKRLVAIYRKAQTSLQEGGANTLFLALGFLLWKRDENDERRFRAPLILLPVALQRQSVRSGVKMVAHDDEPRFNPTLLEMLRKDFTIGIQGLDGALPEDDSGIDVNGIWDTVRRAVVDSSGFEVVEEVALGHFSFAKYLMWKDLVDRTDELRANPVVRHLIDTPRDPYPSDISFVDRNSIDQEFAPKDFLTALPADSSQMAAIATADRGKDFIIIGPPGTGKSQTISNLIAHLLGKEKTVLFVSEKTAALEVVYRRLEQVGLGRFCLELHSNKARKSDVLKQLKDAWHSSFARTEDAWHREAEQLRDLRDRLNRLVDRLHRKHPCGLTAHHAIGVKIQYAHLAERVEFSWTTANQHSADQLREIRDVVQKLQVQARAVGKINSNSLQLISNGEWSPSWEREMLGCAAKLTRESKNLEIASSQFLEPIEIKTGNLTLTRIAAIIEFAQVLKRVYRKQAEFALASDGQALIEALEQSVLHLKAYAALQARLSCPYDSMAWRNLDGEELLERWAVAEKKWVLSRYFAQRAIRKEMQRGGAKGVPDPVSDAKTLIALKDHGSAIDALDKQLNSLRDWSAHDSDPNLLRELHEVGTKVRVTAAQLADTPSNLLEVRQKVHSLLENGNDLLAPDALIGLAADKVLTSASTFQEACNQFDGRSGSSIQGQFAESDFALERIRRTAESIAKRRSELNYWCAWQRRRSQALDKDLGPLVTAIESGTVPVEEIQETFEAAYCTWWSEKLLDEDVILKRFSSAEHMDAIERFRKVDDDFLETTARYIEARLSAGFPKEGDVSHSSQWGLLKKEITKRARHKPVRQLMQEAPEAITRLAPCLMMSPLSIAQYLPPGQSLFDVVIFDEASQITVWDAVGAIARGRQVIVAGDPKQMPPTNFFNRADDDVDGDIDFEGDMESILDELRSSNVPELTLNLHYRSRRESLIAFSNSRYYDNGLVTFPAPESADRGVRLVEVQGYYDRGKSRTNAGEAQAIVADIVSRLNSSDPGNRNQSIGVVTFNAEQQGLIQDLLDRERAINPGIEWAFSEDCFEPVFVKNLETVQGDERDVILFSVTYGADDAGKFSMNFGPLNRDGGERRMNVAITRARSEMVVFSTLHPDKIDLARTGARAVADLKHFLEYAERGPSVLASAVHGSIGDFESPFESAVSTGLRERGWTVHPQIGVSAFRVDLGIVHPDHPGVYLSGVECDGAMYHSSAYARERDKVRQLVLEGLGWTLLRVWSTDWWINKSGELEKLDRKLHDHLEEDRNRRAEKIAKSDVVPSKPAVVGEYDDQSRDSSSNGKVESRWSGNVTGRADGPVDRVAAFRGGDANFRQDEATDVAREENVKGSFRSVQEYVQARIAIPTGAEQLGEVSPSRLIDPISSIVDVESPIHIEDLIRRVTNCAGLHRAGARIQTVVKRAVELAVRDHKIRRKRDFLWAFEKRSAPVRDRSNLQGQDKKLDRIAPEEIARALLDVVERNFSITKSDAISEAASDLGFQRVTTPMNNMIRCVLRALLTKDVLQSDGELLSKKEM